MQPGFRLASRIVALAALIAWAGWWTSAVPSASAQLIECTDQPLLATFDANDDGILSVVEIRQANPDDDTLQEYADELEAADIIGVFYGGCGDLDADPNANADGGDDDAAEPDPPAPDDPSATSDDGQQGNADQVADAAAGGDDDVPTPAGTPDADPSDQDDAEDALVVTTLPGVGHGSLAESATAPAGITAMVGSSLLMATLAVAMGVRTRGSTVP